MRFHKEGYQTIVVTGVAVLGLLILIILLFPDASLLHAIVTGLGIFLLIAILQFFRHPNRAFPEGANLVLSPADGKVVVIEETEESEYLKDRRLQVSIFMSPVNVHVNRCPVWGTVKYIRYYQGKYLVAWHPKSSTENERTTVVIEHVSGTEVLFRQIAGALARRIRWYLQEGQEVHAGEEMGFIKFGSRVDVFLPVGTKLNVTLGQKVRGGETIIAEL